MAAQQRAAADRLRRRLSASVRRAHRRAIAMLIVREDDLIDA